MNGKPGGRLLVSMDDGTAFEIKAGDVALIPPGHDAWVVGNEPFVAVDFTGMREYAKNPERGREERPEEDVAFYE